MGGEFTPAYYRVSPRLWLNRSWSDDTRLLALYLLTSPHRLTEGLFRLPKPYICGDLQWSLERLGEPFGKLLAEGFIDYDEETEVVLLTKAMKYQAPANENVCRAAIVRVHGVPESRLDAAFLEAAERYAKPFAELLRKQLPERYGESLLVLHSCSTSISTTTKDGVDEGKTADSTDCEQPPVEKPIPSPTPPPESPKRKTRKQKTPATCDGGEPCPTLRVKGVRQGIANIDPLHSGQLWQPETDLGGRMAELAAYICESAQDILPALEREQREPACARMLKRAVDRMAAAHAKEPIRNLPAYIVGLLKRQCLGDVIGDDLVEDLRREASASYGKRDREPVAIGAALAGMLSGKGMG